MGCCAMGKNSMALVSNEVKGFSSDKPEDRLIYSTEKLCNQHDDDDDDDDVALGITGGAKFDFSTSSRLFF
jgi:hypothetical protein